MVYKVYNLYVVDYISSIYKTLNVYEHIFCIFHGMDDAFCASFGLVQFQGRAQYH